MYQLWIKNPSNQYQKLGPPAPAADANLWLQVIRAHCRDDLQILEIGNLPAGHPDSWQNKPSEWWEPIQTPALPVISARSVWPGEEQ